MANTRDELKDFVIRWNTRFPYDRYVRKKHNIAFLSEEHKSMSFFASMMEYEEDMLFSELRKGDNEDKKVEYIPNTGDWLMSDFEATRGEVQEITKNDMAMFREEMYRIMKEEEEAAKEQGSKEENIEN